MLTDKEYNLQNTIEEIVEEMKGGDGQYFVTELDIKQVQRLIQSTVEDDFMSKGCIHSSDPFIESNTHELIHKHLNGSGTMQTVMEALVKSMSEYYHNYVVNAFEDHMNCNYSQEAVH